MTVYLPTIPNATDLISTSQGQLKVNFFQLDAQFGVDHSNFNVTGSNGTGFHKKITFPSAPSPTPTTPVNPDTTAYLFTKVASALPNLTFLNSLGNFDFSNLKSFTATYTVSAGSITPTTNTTSYYGQAYGMTFLFGSYNGVYNNFGTPTVLSLTLPIAATVQGIVISTRITGSNAPTYMNTFAPGASVIIQPDANSPTLTFNYLLIYR